MRNIEAKEPRLCGLADGVSAWQTLGYWKLGSPWRLLVVILEYDRVNLVQRTPCKFVFGLKSNLWS